MRKYIRLKTMDWLTLCSRPFLIWKLIAACVLRFCLQLSLLFSHTPVYAAQNLTALWVNDGGDKVTRDELRATKGKKVLNSVWDGARITLFGAKNEVVACNLILEAGSHSTGNITVSFNRLSGPSRSTIASVPATGDGVFDWTQRPIELFYVRYLQIKGLSKLSYENYDERHEPQRLRRPWTGDGYGAGTWQDRPDHDKFYPDIAVPLELVPTFTIPAASNQSIWIDIYIPKTAVPGNYLGNVLVQENGTVVGNIPVVLKVYNFTLPDVPASKTMLFYTSENINHRYFGAGYVGNGAMGVQASKLRDRHFMVAHRHKLSMIGDSMQPDCNSTADQPCPDWVPRLNGSLFTASSGYDGPGVNTGNNVYSIGTYGGWSWRNGTQSDMNHHTDAWVNWFNQNSPSTETFLYLIDESTMTAQIETWSQWILSNPGPGRQLRSMATIALPTAANQCPTLDIPTTSMGVGITSLWQPLVDQYTNDVRKRFYLYNGTRPAAGSTATEDDGVALRQRAWAQYKKHINRWFFWETTYYNNYQGSAGETNVFQQAQTFGTDSTVDPVLGHTGWNYSNGDGVLFYPGTDKLFPADSYGVGGPFASLRLKHWRRGIQDVDYLTLAAAVNPSATQAIVTRMIPKVLWEYGVNSPSDPSYVRTDISWSTDPDVWEAARLQLAALIAGGSGTTGDLPTPTLNLPPTLPVDAQINAGYPSGYDIASFQWSLIPNVQSAGARLSAWAAVARSEIPSSFSTPSTTAQLGGMNLSPGYYQISVMAVDTDNNLSAAAQANVTLVPTGLATVQVYPNPWRAGQPYGRQITFDRLPDGADIKIFTVSGHLVKKLPNTAITARWDLTNDSGDGVASGLYLYLVKTPDGQSTHGKLAIIR